MSRRKYLFKNSLSLEKVLSQLGKIVDENDPIFKKWSSNDFKEEGRNQLKSIVVILTN